MKFFIIIILLSCFKFDENIYASIPYFYKLNPTDIDECRESRPCDHNCTNTEGSYTCSCNLGYSLTGRTRCVGRFKSQVFLLRYICSSVVIGIGENHTIHAYKSFKS